MRHQMLLGAPLVIVLFGVGCGRRTDVEGAKTHYRLAMVELQHAGNDERSWRAALAHLDQSLAKHEMVEVLATKAHMLVMLKQFDQAISCFESILQHEAAGRRRCDIENNYACALAAAGRAEDAHKIWGRLCTGGDYLTPEVAFVNRGRAYLQEGDVPQAKRMLAEAVSIAPDYVDARYYLSTLQAADDSTSTRACEIRQC